MPRFAKHAATLVGSIALVAALFSLFYTEGAERRATWWSALLAAAVQVATLAYLRHGPSSRLLARWTIGSAVRLATLVIYALVALGPMRLPATPALLSLATFFFVSTIIESRSLTS